MARGSSKSSGSTRNRGRAADRAGQAPEETLQEMTGEIAAGADSVTSGEEGTLPDLVLDPGGPEGAAGSDRLAGDVVETTAAELTESADATSAESVTGEGAESVAGDIPDAEVVETPAPEEARAPSAPPVPPPAPAPDPQRSGSVVPLILGGVIAAGIGYGAAYMGWLPTAPNAPVEDTRTAEIAAALQAQGETLAALQVQLGELAAAEPAVAEVAEVDLTPVLERLDGLAGRLDETATGLAALGERVGTLEDRPVLTGAADADTAAAIEAAAALEEELAAERASAEARAAELAAEAEAAAAAAADAEEAAAAAVAEADAQAQAAVARAAAEAALGQVQVALETGAPFAEPLTALADVAEVPEGLQAAAETGVPTRESLQAAFPPLARAALPAALQETAGEGMGDRLGAFVMGQIGGRSVEPREGSDPDAVLSRVEAAVRAGELETALSELEALPEGARALLAPWAAEVETRAAAEAGLAALTATLANSGN